MLNIHATLVGLNGKGILLTGKSGAGKSDLALRMIMGHKAALVADDRVNLEIIGGKLYGSAPKEIAGKLEIRGVGIATFPFLDRIEVALIADLAAKNEIERLPLPETACIQGITIDRLKLFPFENSAIYKIIAKISSIIS